jgi:hypothetical protein
MVSAKYQGSPAVSINNIEQHRGCIMQIVAHHLGAVTACSDKAFPQCSCLGRFRGSVFHYGAATSFHIPSNSLPVNHPTQPHFLLH